VLKILFVCTHNACRSVLAEVLTRSIAGNRLDAASAGSHPAGRIHPLTLEHLAAAGYDTAGLRSKSFEDVRDFDPDIVITVCDSAAKESCPVWLGSAIKAHWGLPDPSHLQGSDIERSAAFDAVMHTIRARLDTLLAQPLESLVESELASLLQNIGEIS
jgi:arsenate reductase